MNKLCLLEEMEGTEKYFNKQLMTYLYRLNNVLKSIEYFEGIYILVDEYTSIISEIRIKFDSKEDIKITVDSKLLNLLLTNENKTDFTRYFPTNTDFYDLVSRSLMDKLLLKLVESNYSNNIFIFLQKSEYVYTGRFSIIGDTNIIKIIDSLGGN